MRWFAKVRPCHGQTRVRIGFLFVPLTAHLKEDSDDVLETRWLERAAWREKYSATWGDPYWYPLHWEDLDDL